METESSLPYSEEPALVSILTQMNAAHTLPSYLFKVQFNILFPPKPYVFLVISFFQVSLPKRCMCFCPMRVTCPGYSSFLTRLL
jgi:hypothetical protein